MYQSLQACRALAALMVVAFHVGTSLSRDVYLGNAADFARRLTSFGDAGVPFFFVLSGFIVTRAHLRDFSRPASMPAYLLKRAARIYPMYWIVFAITFAGALLVHSTGVPMPEDAASFAKSVLLIPQDPAVVGGTGAPVVFVAWTLQYEMLFYAAMALALIRRWLLLIPLGLYVLNRLTIAPDDGFIRHFLASDLICLFGMGVGLALATRCRWRMSAKQAWALCIGVALTFIALAFWDFSHFPTPSLADNVLLMGAASTVGLAALIHLEDGGWRPSPQSMLARLGQASYTLYLIQVVFISVFSKVALFCVGHFGPVGSITATIAMLLITWAIALVALSMHRRIEQPLARHLNRAILKWTDTGKPASPVRALG